MACHTRAGVRCYLDFLPKKVTQQQWHTLRNEVMEEIGEERLSRARVDSTVAIQTGQDLMDALEADGYSPSEQDRRDIIALTRNAPVTEGTVQVIEYLSANGPVSTLEAMGEENEVHVIPADHLDDQAGFRIQDEVRAEFESKSDLDVLNAYKEAKTFPGEDMSHIEDFSAYHRLQGLKSEAIDRNLLDSHGDDFHDYDYKPKYEVVDEDDDDRTPSGTALVGYLDGINYSELLEKFGPPREIGDDKVTVEWVLEFETPLGRRVATIYDWKNGADPVHNHHWNIGAKDDEVVRYIRTTLGRSS